MDRGKAGLLSVIIVAGLLLVIMVYQPKVSTGIRVGTAGATPPPLSPQPFHQSFISEEVCLRCHAQGRDLPAFDLVAKKMPHEPRRMCVACHQLPARI